MKDSLHAFTTKANGRLRELSNDVIVKTSELIVKKFNIPTNHKNVKAI